MVENNGEECEICKKLLFEIGDMVLSLAPTASPVERTNIVHKLIEIKVRAALKHQRVILHMVFCYVNTRLLDF